jgi:hypothetical protein
MKGISYNDLISIITLGLQSLDARLLQMQQYLNRIDEKADEHYDILSTRVDLIERVVRKIIKGKKIVNERKKIAAQAEAVQAEADNADNVNLLKKENTAPATATLNIQEEQQAINAKSTQDKQKQEKQDSNSSSSDSSEKQDANSSYSSEDTVIYT